MPAGSLVVIDDADQLDPKLLRYYTDHATATNTKLLLVHTPDAGRHPAHTVIDALADTLPWTHQIGTPSLQQGWRTATDHVTDLLAQPRCGAPTKAASAAAELLDRRARPLNSYLNTQAQQHHWAHRHKQRDRERVHDRGGLEL